MKIIREAKRTIPYRIELKHSRSRAYDRVEYTYSKEELVDFLLNCIPDGYSVECITRTTSDGKGYDVTGKFKKYLTKQ